MSPKITDPVAVWPKFQGDGHYVAVDTETTGLYVDDGARITVVSLAGDGWSVAIPFAVPGAENAYYNEWDDLCQWLKKQKLIMHHAKFDLDMFRRGAPNGWPGVELVDNVVFDTKLACWVLWPLENLSLKPTAERLWGKDERTEQAELEAWLEAHGHKKHQMWFAPANVLLPYAKQDAEMTYRLWNHFKSSTDAFALWSLIDRELEVMKTLSKMESRGIKFDTSMAAEIDVGLKGEAARLIDSLPFKATRQAALKFWQQSGMTQLAQLPKTPGGQPSLDKEGLGQLVKLGVPMAEHLQKILDLELASTRYFGDRDILDSSGNREASWRMMVGKDGRLRPDFIQWGTVSYRFSCRRVNLQAMPQDYKTEGRYPTPRVCMAPREGMILVGLDLSQAEIRVAAAVTGDKNLRRIVESGEDIHGETTKMLFPGCNESSPDWKAKRFIGKTLNLAIQYGAGIGEISLQLGCNEAQATEYRNRYHNAFPEVRKTMALAQHKADTMGYVTLVSGRRNYFGPDDKTFAAFNRVIQGNVAEFMKDAMIWVENMMPGMLLLQEHDELILEVPDMLIAEDIAEAIESMGTETFGIQMKVDIKAWEAVNEYANS